jgi:hypothetical protein
MKKGYAFAAIVAIAITVTGCSAGSRADEARNMCVTAAEEEAGASVNVTDGQVANMGDALFEEGIKDTRETSDENALFTMTGDVTWTKDGTETRKSMMCMVSFKGGQAEPVELNLF